MNRAEELRHIYVLLVRVANYSPTLLDRILREAGVQENEMARVAQGILAHRQPIHLPFESVNDLLDGLVENHARPATIRLRNRNARLVQSFLQSKKCKRSQ